MHTLTLWIVILKNHSDSLQNNNWMESCWCWFSEKLCIYWRSRINSHQIRSTPWSVKGAPVIVKVPIQRGVTLSIARFISSFGIIDFSKVEPLKPSGVAKTEEFSQPETKKRKVRTNQPAKTTANEGTAAYYIILWWTTAEFIILIV